MTMMRWYNTGAEELASGADVVKFDTSDPWQAAEVIGKGLAGFQPRALSEGRGEPGQLGYEELRMRREFAQYYATRRQVLLNAVGGEHLTSEERREALNDIREFNHSVPFNSMRITGEQVQDSRISRQKTRRAQERGSDTRRPEAGVERDIGKRAY
jgi:hypothetical protein